jgi:oligopeptide/dipeptide ABC transporter ATP-binding protein
VGRGEALGLVGESGSGKTMALRSLVGLLPRAARLVGGEILFEGADLATAPAERLRAVRGREISMVFQEPMTALNPVMRVGEQIAEGPLVRLGYGRRRARQRAVELMQTVGIPDAKRRAGAFPHELSGGMRQRVMIAIALSSDPKLILCDEPTTALDVTIQDQILKLLQRLREDLGVGLVFVSHDLAVIAQTCQHVAVMYAGQVVEQGVVRDVFARPLHPYTRALLDSQPAAHHRSGELPVIPGLVPDLTEPPGGCRFAARCAQVHDRCAVAPPVVGMTGGAQVACWLHQAVTEEVR